MGSNIVIWCARDGTLAGVAVATLIFFYDLCINAKVSVFTGNIKEIYYLLKVHCGGDTNSQEKEMKILKLIPN